MNFPYAMVLPGAIIMASLAGYVVGRRHAEAIDEAAAFNRGVQAEKAIQHAKHSAATRKGHADAKVRKLKELAQSGGAYWVDGTPVRLSSVDFPRPMGGERLPHSDGAA